MNSAAISTEHFDYLQRSQFQPAGLSMHHDVTAAPPELRQLWHVHGVGRAEKVVRPTPGLPTRLISEDVLIGLSGHSIPLAFFVYGQPGGVEIALGTWAPADAPKSKPELEHERETLGAALRSLYPEVTLSALHPQAVQFRRLAHSGFVLGMPTAKSPDQLDGALPLDRLIRALVGTTWGCLVLAQPVAEQSIGKLRSKIIEEMRQIEDSTRSIGAPSPLAKHYAELLELQLKTVTTASAVGMWRTAVYLLGDQASYLRLASLWRAIFSGEQSVAEPVRVFDHPAAGQLAEHWALPNVPGEPGPGRYRHLVQYQTLIPSTQLAAYVHLPQLETSGFSVTLVPSFDVVPAAKSPGSGAAPEKSPAAISVGRIIQNGLHTTTSYTVDPKALTKHVFVAGVTGAGKTTTIRHLLREANRSGVPFLVIEPAKTEYRELLDDPQLGRSLQIFTLGNENISPFRLNPFEVLPGTSVSTHIDLLRSAFAASFGMWTPLPQILEQSLHAIYRDRGWEIVTGTNYRLSNGARPAASFPTLSDLVAKVDEVLRQMDYEQKIKGDMSAALKTRLNSLRTGGKGRMLDTQRSLPPEIIFEQPTILELEGIGDDDDRAFLMGLLLIRLYEYRRAKGKVDHLSHLLVFEEAHRLLANVAVSGRPEEANPRGKAVESFANLLAEVRAYGQGIIIADQVPVKLARDVIKNTNLKIAHRIVDAEDRQVLAGAMAMTEGQMTSLAILPAGRAAVFAEDDDAALLVQVEKGSQNTSWPADTQVKRSMASSHALQSLRARSFFQPHPHCDDTAEPAGIVCGAARALAEDSQVQRTFARLVLSIIEDASALNRLWPELVEVVRARRGPHLDEGRLMHCLVYHLSHWLCSRRGAQNGWIYPETMKLESRLHRLMLAKLDGAALKPLLEGFQKQALQLHARQYDPYPMCSKICKQQVCLYRYAAADFVASSELGDRWRSAGTNDNNRPDMKRPSSWVICLSTASKIASCTSTQIRDRIALCFAQQMHANSLAQPPETPDDAISMLMKETKL